MKLRSLAVSYTQVCIFDPTFDLPFNDWTDAHVAQGFAWRAGSVSFGTLISNGRIELEVRITTSGFRLDENAIRAIAVPFLVPQSGEAEIASIGDSEVVEIPPGEYGLIFEHGLIEGDSMWARFTFIPKGELDLPQILKADEELTVTAAFVMDAKPA